MSDELTLDAGAAHAPESSVSAGTLYWVAAVVVGAVVVATSRFTSTDPDSTAYAEIAGRLSVLPLSRWIAPEWGGTWNFTGLFREHPIGIFVLPALVGRLGYPAEQAAYLVGALISLSCLWLIRRVVAPLTREHEAAAVQWACLILPVAFVYRSRANQEYPVLALTLVALYATERGRRSAWWVPGVVAAALGLALVKGIFVIFLPAICGLWLLLIPRTDRLQQKHAAGGSDLVAWTGVVLAALAVVPLAFAYEAAYHRITGESFLNFYLNQRIAENAGLTTAAPSLNVARKLNNALFYVGRLAWFAMPGTLALLLSVGRVRRPRGRHDVAVRALWFGLLASAMYVVAMSMGANRAERFIFPAYFVLGAAGAVVAIRRWDGVNRLALRLSALPPYVFPLTWLVFFLLGVYTERRIVHVKVWTP